MTETLHRNLEALRHAAPRSAAAVAETAPHPGLVWRDSRQGEAPVAVLSEPGPDGRPRTLALASRFAPLEEAGRLAEHARLDEHAAIIMLGFGLGYHVRHLLRRISGRGVLIVYEPDLALLRAVLETLDYSDVLAHPALILLLGRPDEAEITRRLESHAPAIAQGVGFLSHPPTRRRHGDAVREFSDRFARFVGFCRTNLATTLVNAAVTCRNLAHNLAHYTAGPTIDPLRNAAAGRAAILIAAGPSLARNVRCLTRPGLRQRAVVIAAQTVLKPLLRWGVRPHFVTALDYHEISRRFYEDLPADLADITLIAEPKAHPAILDGYGGPVRTFRSRFLDLLLGPLARPIDALPAGSTVAHLSFYLAQYLGCDPIILVGQDLGFSDGLYYCPGTAIHDVWAGELNPFNTLEMMEWKRIARHKLHLQKRADIHGNPIYTDQQMLTYLAQFERDFAAAPQTVIDATEGGLPKRHTITMALADAIDRHARTDLPPMPIPQRGLDGDRLRRTAEHLQHRIEQVRAFRTVSRKTLPILRRMLRDQRDHQRMDAHFRKLQHHRRRVESDLRGAFDLVNALNQVGLFNRVRADRAIRVADDLDPYERQRRQLHRDIDNVRWIIDACGETLDIFRQALDRITLPPEVLPPEVDQPPAAAGVARSEFRVSSSQHAAPAPGS